MTIMTDMKGLNKFFCRDQILLKPLLKLLTLSRVYDISHLTRIFPEIS